MEIMQNYKASTELGEATLQSLKEDLSAA